MLFASDPKESWFLQMWEIMLIIAQYSFKSNTRFVFYFAEDIFWFSVFVSCNWALPFRSRWRRLLKFSKFSGSSALFFKYAWRWHWVCILLFLLSSYANDYFSQTLDFTMRFLRLFCGRCHKFLSLLIINYQLLIFIYLF